MEIVKYEKVTTLPTGSNITANTLYFLEVSASIFEFYVSDNTGSTIKSLAGGSGSGDMIKSVYDIDNNGIVDNTEALQGEDGAYYLNRTNHTGSQPVSTISDFDTEVSNNIDVQNNSAKRSYPLVDENKLDGIEANAEKNTVDSVNTKTGVVVLDADDINDSTTANKFTSQADINRLANTSGTNTGDQDLTPYALKSNVLELDNTTTYTPTLDYHPATRKYVDDNVTNGDMLKSVYDTNNNNIVDNSEALGGQAGSYYLDRTNHTGYQTASTISDFDTEVSNNADVSANTAKNSYPTADANKLAGIEAGAEVNEIATVKTTNNIDYNGSNIYGTSLTPITGNLTSTSTDAKLGKVQKIYHDDTVEPTFPASWKKTGTGEYLVNASAENKVNVIYTEYENTGRQEYWINQTEL